MSKEDVLINKIKPYPILVKMEGAGQIIHGNIVKLTLIGFLVELNEVFVRVSQNYKVHFVIPVLEDVYNLNTKVVKTYDQFRPPSAHPVTAEGQPVQTPNTVAVRLAEFHFSDLNRNDREKLKQFLVAIGQVPR